MANSLDSITGTAAEMGLQNRPGEGRADKVDKDGAQFGDVWKKMQAQYGEKAEKPREVKKTLGKDDFLKLMVLQMKNQDPTKPFDPEQMGMQMAQFASVEQLQNMNKSLDKMSAAGSPSEKMAMTNMIGKFVTIDRARFDHVEGQNSVVSFKLPKDADSVEVQVLNQAGEVMYSKGMGSMKQGDQSFAWDGIRTNTLPAKGGTYSTRIVAKEANGATVPVQTITESQVIGVSYEGKEPVLLVGDAQKSMKIGLNAISKISLESSKNMNSNEKKGVTVSE